MKKIIALLLCVVMLMGMLSGCSYLRLAESLFETLQQGQTEDTQQPQDSQNPEDSDQPEQNTTEYEEPENSLLTYALDQAMIDEFYRILDEAEHISIHGDDWETVDAKTSEVDDAYMALMDQSQIAYILYCLDQSDETLSQQYLDTNELMTQAEFDYNAMIRRIYQSDSPFKEKLFEGWTQAQIDRMLKHNETISALEERNAEITVEYRELDPYSQPEEVVVLYNELVSNNNQIAQIYGYDNYYEFAYDVVYERDYDVKQLGKMRKFVAQYLPDTYTSALDGFYSVVNDMSEGDITTLNLFLGEDYDTLEKDYVQLYLQDLPQSLKDGMQHMFDNERVVFTDSENAYEGAFTTCIAGEPFCYYGPYYQNSETIVHELGHYYAGLNCDFWSTPMDLCETQSQGNEYLFIHQLRNQMSADMYNVLADFKLINDIGNIIIFVMIDAFEEKVYTHKNAGNLTLEQYDALMEEVAKDYGGLDFVEENIGDVQGYWKQVVLESPVYYISYAVSAVASINLFTLAQQDETAARESYRMIVEEVEEEKGFLWNIQQAGLAGPFEETVYKSLWERYAK